MVDAPEIPGHTALRPPENPAMKCGSMNPVQIRRSASRKCRSIAAASIVAKVFRDGLMTTFDALYEGYGLARNKGYGTEEHLRALRERGPTGLHRTSFKLG